MEASQAYHWDEHQHSNKQQNKPVYITVKEYIQERPLPPSHVTNSVVVASVANVLLILDNHHMELCLVNHDRENSSTKASEDPYSQGGHKEQKYL